MFNQPAHVEEIEKAEMQLMISRRRSGDQDAEPTFHDGVRWAEQHHSIGDQPRYKHVKSQGVYEYYGVARLQTDVPLHDMAELVIYQGSDGSLWARAPGEFWTRFEKVEQA